MVKEELAKVRNQMKQHTDRKRSKREFLVRDEVYLKLSQQHFKALTKQTILKLNPKFYGPFKILEKIGIVAYQLELPKEARIHLVFYVSLLEKAVGRQRSTLKLPPMMGEVPPNTMPIAIVDRRVIQHNGVPLI